ncbi:MAG: hypothetical protein FJX76_15005 [Armatimonadetes bacterium]|nr:hypothetical protein [Armatimonadota bacterium]
MMNKSSMVGYTQHLRADQQVKETDKSKETEKARDSDAEATTAENTTSVGSSSGASRTNQARRNGQEAGGLHRLGRGQVEWQNQERNQGSEWLPPTLRPQAKGAGGNAYNVPYWLLSNGSEQPHSENPQAAHKRLLNGLKNMVHTEIQQYIKSNEPPYAKKTLREIYNVLQDDSAPVQAGPRPSQNQNLNGDPVGFTATNFRRAQSTFAMLHDESAGPGEEFESVA